MVTRGSRACSNLIDILDGLAKIDGDKLKALETADKALLNLVELRRVHMLARRIGRDEHNAILADASVAEGILGGEWLNKAAAAPGSNEKKEANTAAKEGLKALVCKHNSRTGDKRKLTNLELIQKLQKVGQNNRFEEQFVMEKILGCEEKVPISKRQYEDLLEKEKGRLRGLVKELQTMNDNPSAVGADPRSILSSLGPEAVTDLLLLSASSNPAGDAASPKVTSALITKFSEEVEKLISEAESSTPAEPNLVPNLVPEAEWDSLVEELKREDRKPHDPLASTLLAGFQDPDTASMDHPNAKNPRLLMPLVSNYRSRMVKFQQESAMYRLHHFNFEMLLRDVLEKESKERDRKREKASQNLDKYKTKGKESLALVEKLRKEIKPAIFNYQELHQTNSEEKANILLAKQRKEATEAAQSSGSEVVANAGKGSSASSSSGSNAGAISVADMRKNASVIFDSNRNTDENEAVAFAFTMPDGIKRVYRKFQALCEIEDGFGTDFQVYEHQEVAGVRSKRVEVSLKIKATGKAVSVTFSTQDAGLVVSTNGVTLAALNGLSGTPNAPGAFNSFPWIADLASNKFSVLRFVEAVKRVNGM